MKESSSSLRYGSRTYTPELARQVLANKRRNRPLNEGRVKQYIQMFKGDLWCEETGEPLKYDKEGRLCDGQTRLTALSRCPDDTEVIFSEVWGLTDDAIKHLDQGQPRSMKQTAIITGIEGVTDFTFATFKLMFINPNRKSLSRNWLTPPERLELFLEFQECILFASRKMKMNNVSYWRSAVAKAYLNKQEFLDVHPELDYEVEMEKLKERLLAFMKMVDTGIPKDPSKDVGALLVRNLCLQARLRRVPISEQWRVLQRCDHGLKAFLEEKEIQQLYVGQTPLFPTSIDLIDVRS